MNSIKAFLFGVTLAISVGPIALLLINVGLSKGWKAAVPGAIGVALADLVFALLGFGLGASLLIFLVTYQSLLKNGAAIILILLGLWMIYHAIQQYRSHAALNIKKLSGTEKGHFLATMFFLTLANPLTIITFISFANLFNYAGSWLLSIHCALMVFLGSLLVQIFWALASAWCGSLIKHPQVIPCLNILSGIGILLFGLYEFF